MLYTNMICRTGVVIYDNLSLFRRDPICGKRQNQTKRHYGMKLHLYFLSLLLLFSTFSSAAQNKQILKKMDEQSYAAISFKRGSYLDVRVDSEKELIPALKIYVGQLDQQRFSFKKRGVVKINSKRALVPFSQLSPGFQKSWLQKVWPDDVLKNGYLHHTVAYSGHETLWTLAELFTGNGQNYKGIKKASGLRSDQIGRGRKLKIPESMLRDILKPRPNMDFGKPKEPVFAAKAEVRETAFLSESDPKPVVSAPGDPVASRNFGTDETPKTEAVKEPGPNNKTSGTISANAPNSGEQKKPSPQVGEVKKPQNQEARSDKDILKLLPPERKELTYGEDSKGRYAQYKLKAGEAIYSSVVVRFCGLVKANDVNRVAGDIIAHNGIKDETDLAIGHPIRIPYDLLEAEFKSENDPEFIAYLENLEDISQVSTRVLARDLEGVYIILDSGHGGRDPGARFGNVWEDDFVYDIICRIKKRLEVETSATVFTTVMDPSVQYKIQDVSRFSQDKDEFLLTSPRFPLNSTRVTTDGVNLRWLIANHRFHKLREKGVPEENVVFASFHADSLHRSLSGSMVYVPDARKYPKNVAPSRRFKKYREYQGSNFNTNHKMAQQAQAHSTNLARHFINESRDAKLPIHRQKPIRSVIFRNPTTPFVPAVLRYNRIPTRCLIEVCNLNNKKDRTRLKDSRYRQGVADAFVSALYKTYGQNQNASLVQSARTRQSGE